MFQHDGRTSIEHPYVDERGDVKSLRFADLDLQSCMSKADPVALLLDYTKTMMAFLLFAPRPRRIALIGLGGGSLAKFCHAELPDTVIDAVEIDARVVALRDEFLLPRDDERFLIHIDDGAHFMAHAVHRYDVILLDGYTQDGIPAALASHQFYRDCRTAMCASGVMVSNLHGPDAAMHCARIRRMYRDQVIVFEEQTSTNKTVLAFNDRALKPAPPDASLLDSARLGALLPGLFARCESLRWPARRSVARR